MGLRSLGSEMATGIQWDRSGDVKGDRAGGRRPCGVGFQLGHWVPRWLGAIHTQGSGDKVERFMVWALKIGVETLLCDFDV